MGLHFCYGMSTTSSFWPIERAVYITGIIIIWWRRVCLLPFSGCFTKWLILDIIWRRHYSFSMGPIATHAMHLFLFTPEKFVWVEMHSLELSHRGDDGDAMICIIYFCPVVGVSRLSNPRMMWILYLIIENITLKKAVEVWPSQMPEFRCRTRLHRKARRMDWDPVSWYRSPSVVSWSPIRATC